MKSDNKKQGRLLSYDYIRIVAMLLVLLVHVSAYVVIQYPTGTEFVVGNVFNGLSRAGVPMFVLLSGALLLDERRSLDTKKFYKKTLAFMIFLTIGWLLFYGLFYAVVLPGLKDETVPKGAFRDFLLTFQGSDYPHLWYMFLVIGMYLLIPVLRLFVKKENKNYVIGIIVACVVIQFLSKLMDLFTRGSVINVSEFVAKFHMESATGYMGYLLLGWYFAHYSLDKKTRISLYFLGAAAVVGSIVAVQYYIADISNIRGYLYNALSVPELLYGCALFVLIQSLCGDRGTNRGAAMLSDLCFGIYMIHILYLELFTQWLIPYDSFGMQNPLVYIILIYAIVFGLSLVTVYVVSKIKYLKKIFYLK